MTMTTPVNPGGRTPASPAGPTGWARRTALVVPLVLVNTSAIYGQGAWAYDHLVPPALHPYWYAAIGLCILFAATVECVGIYLAYEAHAALMEDQSAGMLRLGSYAVALVVGTLNYAHFASPGYRPNPLAVTFGLLSSLSPWLWAIRSRSMQRAALLAKGLVDPRAVRFTIHQRLLYPIASFKAYRLAVWNGVNNPVQARADYDAARTGTTTVTAAVVPPPATPAGRTPLGRVPVPPIVLAGQPVVPPAIEAVVPPARTPRPRTPAVPRTPERPTPARAIDTSTTDAVVLAKLRAAYPGRTPSLSEVSAIAGGKQPRAVRLRKLLVAQDTIDDDKERSA